MNKDIKESIVNDVHIEDISFPRILMMAVNRIHKLSSVGYSIVKPVETLKQMLRPYFDNEFNNSYKKIVQKKNQEGLNAINFRNQTGKKARVSSYELYYIEIFGLLMLLMNRRGLLLKETIMEDLD